MTFRDLTAEADADETQVPIELLEAQIADVERRLIPFTGHTWDALETELRTEQAVQSDLMLRGKYTADQLFQVRGRLQALDWALSMPENLRIELNQLTDQLAEASETTTEGE